MLRRTIIIPERFFGIARSAAPEVVAVADVVFGGREFCFRRFGKALERLVVVAASSPAA